MPFCEFERDGEDVKLYYEVHLGGYQEQNEDNKEQRTNNAAVADSTTNENLEKVLFIHGLTSRGRWDSVFKLQLEHLTALRGDDGKPVCICAFFDNRGVGQSSIPSKKKYYTIECMVQDTLQLMQHLKWSKAHVISISMGSMIAMKMAAAAPQKFESLTVMGSTASGVQSIRSTISNLGLAIQGNLPSIKQRMTANLYYNFSPGFLQEKTESGKTRKQEILENYMARYKQKDYDFMCEWEQPREGKSGQLQAVKNYRMTRPEFKVIRQASFPKQVIHGRYDTVALPKFGMWMAQQMKCPGVLVDSAHAGITLETAVHVNYLCEFIVLHSKGRRYRIQPHHQLQQQIKEKTDQALNRTETLLQFTRMTTFNRPEIPKAITFKNLKTVLSRKGG